ncbi:hypothetical protein HIM_02030 [Hirsutella minnesotensis 3608]|nr:hypothetical protein HIM_02030 [Hirsutella minnesotensis 3608]
MEEDPGFSLFTSIRYDAGLRKVPSKGLEHAGWNFQNESPLYMLDFHRDRILRAARHWRWELAEERLSGKGALEDIASLAQEAVGENKTRPLRVRVVVDKKGDISFQTFDTPALPLENLFPESLPAPGVTAGPNEPRPEPRFILLVDDTPVTRSEFTHFKTTRRAMYDAARTRAAIGPKDQKEVLIISAADKSIMEGSITTPYFWRGGRWVTPPVASRFDWEQGSGGQDGTSRRWALERGLAVEEAVFAESLVEGEQCWISNGVGGFRQAIITLK